MNPRTVRRKAFSLVELMVVVAVLALLISLLLPTLRQAREHARSIQCRSIMRGDGMLKAMVGQDTRYMIHVSEHPGFAMQQYGRYFILNTSDFPSSAWLFHAPLDKWAGEKPNLYSRQRKDAVCPSYDRGNLPVTAMSYNNSYVWNIFLRRVHYGGPIAGDGDLMPRRYDVIRPQAILMVDGWAYPTAFDTNYYFYPTAVFSGSGYKEMPYRHLGQANFLAQDGSVMGYAPDAVPDKNVSQILR
jgi:prepilin-type N-terminal cleavage/methylation domain-containing protein/prepilin-type processing-associated H-X9-DG protein